LNKLIEKVIKTIEKYNLIEQGDKIIVAVSGGPDSICLLDILNHIKHQYNLSLIIAHVHHGIRIKESDVEARFVRLKSAHLKLPFEQLTISVPEIARNKGLSIEQAGRTVRYQFFKNLLNKYQAQKIALGHNADDQVETILMRIIRGSGLRGLRGIPPKRDPFIRPLIECNRSEIEAYCQRKNIAFCIDSSNKEPKYLRNKIRQQLIPLLKEQYNPAIDKHLLQLQTIIQDELDFWDEIIEQYYLKVLHKEYSSYLVLDIEKLIEMPPGIQRSVIRRCLRHLKCFLDDIQFNHIEDIRLLCLKERGEKFLDLPGEIRVRKSYRNLTMGFRNDIKIPGEEKKSKPWEYNLSVGKATKITHLGIKFIAQQFDYTSADYEKLMKNITKNEIYVDYDKLELPLKIRNRRPGDRFQPLNSKFFKKVKSYYIDQKINRCYREKIMLIVDNSDRIVWIAGFQMDERFKITRETKKVLYIKQMTL
jgi:tRNA(Ile)-lysidine synthase